MQPKSKKVVIKFMIIKRKEKQILSDRFKDSFSIMKKWISGEIDKWEVARGEFNIPMIFSRYDEAREKLDKIKRGLKKNNIIALERR